jgi:hypothetical protein
LRWNLKHILEDGEVEGETQSDRMRGGELGNGNVGSGLVSLERLVGRVLSLVTSGELGEVSVVVSHLVVEDLGLASSGRGDEVLVEDLEDVLTDLGELGLDLFPVRLDHGDLSLVAFALLLLLDGGDDSPRCSSSTNDVLVGDGKKVSLLDSEFLVRGSDGLHVFDHL